MEYRIVFHPKAESELEALYDDIVERASPSVAWNLAAVSATIVLACRGFLKGAPRGMRSCPGCGLLVTGAVSIAFAVEGERVLILGIFYAGHNITPELLEERL